MKLINSGNNGATEIPGTSADALFVFLAGPIRHWWGKGRWYSLAHWRYTRRRKKVHRVLSGNYLVYAPHRAWRGPWNEAAQLVNDAAVAQCHVLVEMYLPGVVAAGTAAEVAAATANGIPVFRLHMDSHFRVSLPALLEGLESIDTRRRQEQNAAAAILNYSTGERHDRTGTWL